VIFSEVKYHCRMHTHISTEATHWAYKPRARP